MNNSIKAQLKWAKTQILSDSPVLDAEILLEKVLGQSKSYFFTWPEKQLTQDQMSHYQDLVAERRIGKPIAYILGEQEFWSLLLKVTPDTLIPRPETEQLVEAVLQQYQEHDLIKVLDVGTGSGAIALALAKERPHWDISASDFSEKALEVAALNNKNHQLQITFFQNDWLANIEFESFDIIVSNPPYISIGDKHLQTLVFEPISALVAPDDGLADIKTIVSQSMNVLTSGGRLYIEHGYNQGDEVKNIFTGHGFINVVCEKDYAGKDRFTIGEKPL